MFEWNGFNYWAPEHYDHKVVQGTEEHCLALFRAEQMNRPTRKYGTRIVDKEYDQQIDEWQMVFRWFKTEELCGKGPEMDGVFIPSNSAVSPAEV